MARREPESTIVEWRPSRGAHGQQMPFAEVRRMTCELAADFARPGSAVYEIGSATGSVLPALRGKHIPDVRFVRIDDAQGSYRRGSLSLWDASVAVLLMSLGRLAPAARAALIADIYRGLNDGGCLLAVETLRTRSSLLNNLFVKHRVERGTTRPSDPSQIEEARQAGYAFETADTFNETREALVRAGFRAVEVFFSWYGTCGIAALK